MTDKKGTTKQTVVKDKDAKYGDLAKLSLKELAKKVVDTKKDLEVLKDNTKLGDVQNVRAYKYKRRHMAKLLTALNSKQQQEEDK